MNRIVLLGLAFVALATAQYNSHSKYRERNWQEWSSESESDEKNQRDRDYDSGSYEDRRTSSEEPFEDYGDSPFLRRKRQAETPFVGQEEGREQNTPILRHGDDDDRDDRSGDDEEDFGGRHHHHGDGHSHGDRDDVIDDNSGDDSFEDGRPRIRGPGPVMIMTPQGPVMVPQPGPRVVRNPDGSLTVLNADGSIMVPQPQVVQNPDGSFTLLPLAPALVPQPNGPPMVQNPDGSLAIQDPSLAPIPAPLPAPQPDVFGQEAQLEQDGSDGVLISFPPQPLPEPAAQQGFRPSGNEGQGGFRGPTTSTTETPLPQSNRPTGFFPPSTLTCSSVRCPSGAVCRMENSRFSRREEPVCVFTGNNAPSSCSQVRCSSGFECEMQQSSSCSRLPCPSNPVCVQTPVTTPAPPVVSCDSVRCSAGTVCRIQAVDHCTSVPCAMQAACVSACASLSCPSNQQCRVDDRTLRPTCVNTPAQSPTSCRDIRCNGRNERCAMIQNCHWSRGCRDEPKCINF